MKHWKANFDEGAYDVKQIGILSISGDTTSMHGLKIKIGDLLCGTLPNTIQSNEWHLISCPDGTIG